MFSYKSGPILCVLKLWVFLYLLYLVKNWRCVAWEFSRNYEEYFLQALRVRQLINQDFENVFSNQRVDLLLTPTVLGDAPVYETFIKADNRTRTQEQDIFTQPSNLAGELTTVVWHWAVWGWHFNSTSEGGLTIKYVFS